MKTPLASNFKTDSGSLRLGAAMLAALALSAIRVSILRIIFKTPSASVYLPTNALKKKLKIFVDGILVPHYSCSPLINLIHKSHENIPCIELQNPLRLSETRSNYTGIAGTPRQCPPRTESNLEQRNGQFHMGHHIRQLGHSHYLDSQQHSCFWSDRSRGDHGEWHPVTWQPDVFQCRL